MYKNQLQELAQRSCFNLPSYACIREGPDHAPRFKATVTFNGESFESPGFCSTLRLAEHAAAEVALTELSKRGPSSSLAAKVLDETGIYKNLLQETAHRAGLKLPMYTTIRSGPGHTPTFTCTVELAGRIFTGNPGKTKKQAQKNAAMAAWSELKQLPLVGEAASSSSPSHHDDEEQEQITVACTLESLNQKNEGKTPYQKEKQQHSNRPQSRRSYPRPYVSFYGSHLQNQTYPNVAPEQGMYHMWHQVQATQQKPHFSMVPTMGSTRFPPPPAMLSLYPQPRGQFAVPANQTALALLPCFPEASPILPRYFSPFPASYVPTSPLPAAVNMVHGKRQGRAEMVELTDPAIFSRYSSPDSSSTPENVGLDKVRQWPKNGQEAYIESSTASGEENEATQTLSTSTTHPLSQNMEQNQDKESKKPAEHPPKSSSLSRVGPSVVQRPVQRQSYTSPVQQGEPIHRNNLPFRATTSPEPWSSEMPAPARFGTAAATNSAGFLYQQRPPWLAAPVTVRTSIPVCSARPNAMVNSSTEAATQARPAVQFLSRKDSEAHRNSDASTASSELDKLHI